MLDVEDVVFAPMMTIEPRTAGVDWWRAARRARRVRVFVLSSGRGAIRASPMGLLVRSAQSLGTTITFRSVHLDRI